MNIDLGACVDFSEYLVNVGAVEEVVIVVKGW